MTSVLLVINEPVTAAGLRSIFNADPGFSVAAEDNQVNAAITRLSNSIHPDVVVVDARELHSELFACLTQLTKMHPDTPVLLIAPQSAARTTTLIFAAGVRGYLTKPVSTSLITVATEALHCGANVFSPGVGDQLLLNLYAPTRQASIDALTHQEHRVLEQLAAGRSNEEIGVALNLASATVKKHLSSLMHKTGTRDRLQAGLLGWQHGLGREYPPQRRTATTVPATSGSFESPCDLLA